LRAVATPLRLEATMLARSRPDLARRPQAARQAQACKQRPLMRLTSARLTQPRPRRAAIQSSNTLASALPTPPVEPRLRRQIMAHCVLKRAPSASRQARARSEPDGLVRPARGRLYRQEAAATRTSGGEDCESRAGAIPP